MSETLGAEISVEFSVGYAFYPADGSDYHFLMHLADEHMYQEKKQRKAAPCGRAKERGERKTLRRHAGNRPPPAGGRRASVVMIADRRKRFHQEQVKIRRKVRKTLQSTCLAQKVSSIRGRFWLLDDVLPGWRQVRRWHCFPQNLRSFRTANHSFFQTVH